MTSIYELTSTKSQAIPPKGGYPVVSVGQPLAEPPGSYAEAKDERTRRRVSGTAYNDLTFTKSWEPHFR
jgi:hypothetical protein